jgi:hypothetical protein
LRTLPLLLLHSRLLRLVAGGVVLRALFCRKHGRDWRRKRRRLRLRLRLRLLLF